MRLAWRQHLDETGLDNPGLRLGRQLVARHASPWRRYNGLSQLGATPDLIVRVATLIERTADHASGGADIAAAEPHS